MPLHPSLSFDGQWNRITSILVSDDSAGGHGYRISTCLYPSRQSRSACRRAKILEALNLVSTACKLPVAACK